MPRGSAIWIQNQAPTTTLLNDGVRVNIASDVAVILKDEAEALRCAEEIVAVLRRYGINTQVQQK